MPNQLTEAGKRHNKTDMAHLDAIHTHAVALGAMCNSNAAPGKDEDGDDDSKESIHLESLTEAAHLRVKDSHDATRQALSKALKTAHGVSEYSGWNQTPQVRDVFDDHVVYDHLGKTLKRKYAATTEKEGEPRVTFNGPPTQVDIAYVPTSPTLPGGYSEAERDSKIYFSERSIPQAEREKIPAEDFAGKNKSFPIVKPEDVTAAAASIGRAGSDNYSSDELKKRIIAIAKRKGEEFEAKLPKSWEKALDKAEGDKKESQESTAANLIESELAEMTECAFVEVAA